MADKPAEFNNPEFANDGEINSELDGAGKRRLLVTDLSNNNPSGAPGAPVLSKKLRFEFDDSAPTITTTYSTVFLYSGSGKFFFWEGNFALETAVIKLSIDSEVIFEESISDLDDMKKLGHITGWFDIGRKELSFNPDYPIAYSSEVKVEAKVSAAPNDTLLRSFVGLSKET